MVYFFTGLLALSLGLYLTPLAMKAALEMRLTAKPDGRLRLQPEPVPYLGGMAIYLALLLALAFSESFTAGMVGLLLGTTIILMVGLIDDFGVMTPGMKLFGQIIAALALLKGGIVIQLTILDFRWPLDLPLLAWFLSAIWLIGIANALNFLDIEDGLAGGTTLCALPALFVVALWNGRTDAALFSAALFGGTLGFLRYNAPWPRARIYLGDAGSLFLGLALAALAMRGSYTANNNLAAVCPVLILGVPCFELGLTMMARWGRGVPVWHGSPDHAAKRLQKLGLSRNQTLLVHCGAGLGLGGLALFIMQTDIVKATVAVSALGVVALVALVLLLRIQMEPPAPAGEKISHEP